MCIRDSVILACGAKNPRDIKAPGRDAKGIYFAVDFLKATTKSLFCLLYTSSDAQTQKYVVENQGYVYSTYGDIGQLGDCLLYTSRCVQETAV